MAVASTRVSPATEAWRLLGDLMHGQRQRFFAVASEFELSPPQILALRWLEDEMPMSHLAGRLHCDNSNVTGIIDRLEDRGLVSRRAAEHDRRVKHLVLTAKGRELRERVLSRLDEPPAEIAGLSVEDQRALRDILRRADRSTRVAP